VDRVDAELRAETESARAQQDTTEQAKRPMTSSPTSLTCLSSPPSRDTVTAVATDSYSYARQQSLQQPARVCGERTSDPSYISSSFKPPKLYLFAEN